MFSGFCCLSGATVLSLDCPLDDIVSCVDTVGFILAYWLWIPCGKPPNEDLHVLSIGGAVDLQSRNFDSTRFPGDCSTWNNLPETEYIYHFKTVRL